MQNIKHLVISWSVSRGRDTYGYNICRLDDHEAGKRFKTCGGGYDMIGTVFADWLVENYQERLLAIADRAGYVVRHPGLIHNNNGLYGMTYYPEQPRISIDGACGIESVVTIAEAIGLEVQRDYDHRPRGRQGLQGFYVVEKG